MNLLGLPKDVLLDIWSFVTNVRDIFRFRATCKQINSLAFQVPRCIYLERHNHPLEIIDDIFMCDLGLCRQLNFFHPYNHYGESFWIMKRLKILPNLHNLTELALNVELDKESLPDLAQIIRKMTWLTDLAAQFHENENIGEILKYHRRMTALTINSTGSEGSGPRNGLQHLTHLKSLKFPKARDILDQILCLTNLNELEISFSTLEADTSKLLAKSLTNLEYLSLCGSSSEDFDWRAIKTLPKLRKLQAELRDDWYFDQHFEGLNELAPLTSLQIFTVGTEYGVAAEQLSNLTNLRELRVEMEIGGPLDFSKFPFLSKLEFKGISNTEMGPEQIQLPVGLKSLTMDNLSINCNLPFMNKVYAQVSLERLQMSYEKRTEIWPEEVFDISRLTNLTFLDLHEGPIPKGIGERLQQLTNLQILCIKVLSELSMQEFISLKQLIQLNALRIFSPAQHNIGYFRQQFPFMVNIE